jgi:hypothetical protein
VVPEPAPAPSPAPSAPSASVAVQVDPNLAVLAAKARAESSRQKAVDFKGPAYFPGEWESTEAGYVDAGRSQNEAGYNAAADGFEGIFSKTVPLYAQDRADEAIALRDSVISAGINDLYPEELYAADLVALDGVAQYEAEDYSAANITAAKSLGIYQALNVGMDVYNVRQEILNRNFTDYDSYNFNRADDISLAAIDSYEAGNIEKALDGAEEVKPLYNRVLSTGWAAATGQERQNALDMKANIAVRNEFDAAEKLYSQAEAARKAGKYEESADLYNQSASRFTSLVQTVTEKRRIATEALRAVEKKVAESEEAARDAELILEGGV